MARADHFPKRFLSKGFLRIAKNIERQEAWLASNRLKGSLKDHPTLEPQKASGKL
jgi:hypothetical protein